MKTLKRILAMTLAIMMVMGLSVAAFAADCPDCTDGKKTVTCPTCDGTGEEECPNGCLPMSHGGCSLCGDTGFITCRVCNGLFTIEEDCTTCGGDGIVDDPAPGGEEEPTYPGSITINSSVEGKLYDLYKIFDLTGANLDEDGAYANVAYTISNKWAGFFATAAPGASYIVDAQPTDGNLNPISINGATKYINITEDNVAAFAQAALAYAAANNIAPDTKATGNGENLLVNNLELGYYMVYPEGAADIDKTSGYASICSLTSTVPAAVVNIKATYPTIDKEITEKGEEPAKVNEAAIGDTIPYTITTKIPDMTGYTKYFFVAHDTLSNGLTLNNTVENGKNTGFTVKIGETTGETTLTEGIDYDVDIDGQSFRIIFKDMVNRQAANVGKTVTIEYSATLNDSALVNEANTNTATIEYSNDPYVKPEYEEGKEPENHDDPDDENYTFKKGDQTVEPTGESEESQTETYTTSLTLKKVDVNKNILSGAEFTLTGATNRVRVTTSVKFEEATDGTYYKLTDGRYTEDAPVEEHVEVADNGEYVVLIDGYELKEGQESFTVGGITYRALEVNEEVPDGTARYNHILSNADQYENDGKLYKKTSTTEVHINTEAGATSPDTVKGFVDATTGLITFEGLGEGSYTLTESVTPEGYNTIDPITFTVTFDAANKKFSGTNIVLELTEIENLSGTELPSTGGIGTTIFYVVGGILLAGAGVLLITKKRMHVED